jgi:hypothetical protein
MTYLRAFARLVLAAASGEEAGGKPSAKRSNAA